MACPYCQGEATQALERTTTLGYRLYRCRPCRRTFNERTGTPFNHLQVPTIPARAPAGAAAGMPLRGPAPFPAVHSPVQTVEGGGGVAATEVGGPTPDEGVEPSQDDGDGLTPQTEPFRA